MALSSLAAIRPSLSGEQAGLNSATQFTVVSIRQTRDDRILRDGAGGCGWVCNSGGIAAAVAVPAFSASLVYSFCP